MREHCRAVLPRTSLQTRGRPRIYVTKPPASHNAHGGYTDSRGGTRTRDPGIMSSDAPPEKSGPQREDAP